MNHSLDSENIFTLNHKSSYGGIRKLFYEHKKSPHIICGLDQEYLCYMSHTTNSFFKIVVTLKGTTTDIAHRRNIWIAYHFCNTQ